VRGRPARRRLAPALAGLVLLAGASCAPLRDAPDDYGAVGKFSLADRGGETVTDSDLRGKVWVASFVLTRCPDGKCPQVSATMQKLQQDLAGRPDLRFVSFTLDRERDDPGELDRYAEHFGAEPGRWLFLTGDEDQVRRLEGFHVPAPQKGAKRSSGEEEVIHSQKLVVVDRRGHVRGYFDGLPDPRLPPEEFDRDLLRLKRTVDELLAPELPAYFPRDFPRFNASLNALAAGLLLAGFAAVRARLLRLHASLMLTALGVSALFLTSYLYYHVVVRGGRPTRFAEQAAGAPDWVAYVYLGVLLTHTVLAAVAAPLALYTAYQGLRGRIERHRRVARWALPVWLYVSVTGVVVYWMLYRLYPPA
jgi:protein SCO1